MTSFTLSAAPPRASPSSLVRTTPVMVEALVEAPSTIFTASWPIIASTTRKMFSGAVFALMSASSCMSGSSIARRPAVS